MKYQISVAEMHDTETLVQFQLAMAQESEGTQLEYVTVSEGVKNAIEDESKAIYLIARNEDNEAIGSLMLTTEWSDWNNARYYWIQSVYVHPEFRRQGVFRELFEFARVIAENDNAGALRLYVDKENIVAQKVYQSLGMHDSHYLMYEL
jgi:ribosomal protein S18 acetylase RimI-like enzyme